MEGKMALPLLSRILCPVDLDGASLTALRLGRLLAERNGATLSLIHVMTPRVPGGVVLKDDKEQARLALERMVEGELDGIEYEMMVRWGNAAKEIIAAETELAVQLCVMPNAGRMGTSHLFMRSVTERVARESPCPVLTVGSKARQAKD